MEATREALMNAEIAFSNNQLNEALEWYQKVLDETPDDIYVLSRAGAICVPLGKFEDALTYFERAKNLDPENGDNYFNCANACFFNKDSVSAFSNYVEAERLGCSDDVAPRLYYQMALLCSMRQDIKSSLAYFAKCEAADKDGMLAISPDTISEKLKLFMALQDYDNAERCAAQLVAIQPTDFKHYMVYYSILMAHKKFSSAKKVLENAGQYAELTENDQFVLALQRAALLMAQGDANDGQGYSKAINLLENLCASDDLTDEQNYQAVITLSEAYLKAELYDKAISRLYSVLSPKAEKDSTNTVSVAEFHELSDDEIERLVQQDIDRIQEKIDCGEIDDSLGTYATIEYDEEGNERHVYDDSVFSSLKTSDTATKEESPDPQKSNSDEMTLAFREKIYFTLLSAFLGKDDFSNASKYANILKHSENKYYAYYGLYISTLAELKINGKTSEVEHKYAEAIAFFRNRSFEDHSDSLASVFRARLYVEQGKTEKAREIAHLLSEEDRQAVLDYVDNYPAN